MKNEKIIFATKNRGKIKEINMIMKDTKYEVISMEDAGIDMDIVEDGVTFEENAVIKASKVMEIADCIVMADDSGLEIDYLNKAPGIYSARFGGEDTPYSIKNKMIIDKLKGVEEKDRTARFVCAIAVAFPNGDILTNKEVIEGYIINEEKGTNGFGYDPIFYVPEYDCTTAEMDNELKNEISHRGKALRSMKLKMESYMNDNR
ncbi:non-canonical purine NTP pyrophosphatase [Vallitalea longa]|uniref:dITP/XTP pyrophosphatase n=1 Tax=Vallitalea longa TaxID=2936439 RepID=A0A9W6DE80_9FIRM|nr:XTP/dITP diphosphatase [Vallitalea longa]GKX28128.1 non-canonical purine NTP pyrophosphatase [Vallitalea longa]